MFYIFISSIAIWLFVRIILYTYSSLNYMFWNKVKRIKDWSFETEKEIDNSKKIEKCTKKKK